ncbi:effector-associated domain EAD1-containing protein, partial [bacterium]|nr:effector-associated domain EAD1-containing protein [bacterium]
LDGLRLLSQKVPAQEVLNVALSDLDNRLHEVAGDSCAQNPALLSQLDIKNRVWRRILFYSLKKSHRSWEGIQEPEKLVHALMDRVLQDEKVEDDLLLKIAEMSHGSIINYPKRPAIWTKLDSQIARPFLQTTAEGWIKRLQSNPSIDTSVEKALEDVILSPQNLSKILDPNQPNLLSVGITLFTHFDRLGEDDFNRWLRNVLASRQAINLVNAVLIGELIKRRRWRSAAYMIYHYRGRDDLQPALKECSGMLDLFDRLFLSFSMGSGNVDDWWMGLTDVAVELYPRGLDHEQIWTRAGGDLSIVSHHQAGRDQWEFALSKLRKGGGGKEISHRTLLKQMRKDYHNNQKLEVLDRWKDQF